MSVKPINYEIEFNSTRNFRKYSTKKDDIISAYLEIKSNFKEYEVDYTKTKGFVFFDLHVEAVPSSVFNIYGPLCYPASIEEKLLSFIEEVSEKYNLRG